MKRRNALKTVAGIITGTGLSTVVSGEDTPAQVVHLVPEPHGVTQSVNPNTPVTHRFGWRTAVDEGPDVLREVLDVASYQAYFDDEPLAHRSSHWGAIQAIEDTSLLDQWRVEWQFRLPAVAPGSHEFKVEVNYNRPFTSKVSGGYEKTRSGIDVLTGQYTVPHA